MSMTMKPLTRRDFLRTTGTLGLGTMITARAGAAAAQQNPELRVPTRPFGKSGVQVSILSLGGTFDIPSNQLLLKQALNWGVTYWDTADSYEGGNSEKGIGKYFQRDPEARKQVFLVTKSDDRDAEGMTRLLNRSLERMNTTFVDLYFLHGVRGIDEVDTRKIRTWAEQAKRDGKIRLFGFSTHKNMEDCMQGAARLGWIDGIMMTYNFRLMHTDRMKAAVEACVKSGIGLTAMKTQGGGQVRTGSETELRLGGRFLERGFTDAQAKLKAIWENPHIASICSQMPNLTLLKANVAAATDRTALSMQEKDLLAAYARETASCYCAGCANLCEPSLSARVPVSDLMRSLMYSRTYGDLGRAREIFRRLPDSVRTRISEIDYHEAEERCPHHMPIGRLMREAASELV
jgi:hypothetical protein